MRLLFITDLHGDARKYDKVGKTAQQHHVDIVLNGGDMLPHNGVFFHQDRFIARYLHKHFQWFEEAKIHYLCFLGNDDLKIFDPLFEQTCRQYQYVHNLAQLKVAIHDREFIGMNWIVDTPFRLKDRCRKDSPDFIFPRQVGKGRLSTERGWQELDNWFEYAEALPTIADELQKLPRPLNMQQSVYIIHMPPAHLGLDVCGDGRDESIIWLSQRGIGRIFYTLFVIFMLSCNKNPTDTKDKFNISGRVYFAGQEIANVSLSLKKDHQIIQETTSDMEGRFSFSEVDKGEYSLLSSRAFEDSSFIEDSMDLNVSLDISLDHLILPKPVKLYSPLDMTNTAVMLCWSSFNSEQFYEYKIYRHYTSALDEETGELIHISTAVSDTTYFDDLSVDGYLSRNTTVYYRVYVNNNYGKMSGSNILKVTTKKWEDEESFTAIYNLNTLFNFSGFRGSISGIDFDGQMLWIATVQEIGGYYDNDNVIIYKYDMETKSTIAQFEYHDEYIPPSGLTCANDYLWLNYDASGAGDPKIKKIDPKSGQIIQEISTVYGIKDSSFDGNNLLFCYYYNQIEQIDINTFALVNTFKNPFGGGADFGIAFRPGEIWLTSRSDSQIAIINETGMQIGVANTDELTDWNDFGPRLCFMNENLLLAKNSRIYVFDITKVK